MKKMNIFAMIVFMSISVVLVSCIEIDAHIFVRGNGIFATSERFVSSFEKIHGSGSVEIRYHASREYRVVVTVDSNLEQYVKIETRNNVLEIGTKNGSYSFTKYLVDVYCPSLSSVSLSGSCDFFGDDAIIVSRFESNLSGSGKLKGTIECDNFTAKITGSGKMTVFGNSTDSHITISGSGDFYGNEFYVNNADVHISGSGKANIWVTDYLKARITGSGVINYRGNPRTDISVTGSGHINQL